MKDKSDEEVEEWDLMPYLGAVDEGREVPQVAHEVLILDQGQDTFCSCGVLRLLLVLRCSSEASAQHTHKSDPVQRSADVQKLQPTARAKVTAFEAAIGAHASAAAAALKSLQDVLQKTNQSSVPSWGAGWMRASNSSSVPGNGPPKPCRVVEASERACSVSDQFRSSARKLEQSLAPKPKVTSASVGESHAPSEAESVLRACR